MLGAFCLSVYVLEWVGIRARTSARMIGFQNELVHMTTTSKVCSTQDLGHMNKVQGYSNILC
jgi:hypothetical protein